MHQYLQVIHGFYFNLTHSKLKLVTNILGLESMGNALFACSKIKSSSTGYEMRLKSKVCYQ